MRRFLGVLGTPVVRALLILGCTVFIPPLSPRDAAAATIFVTTTQQKISGSGGCSLQEAIWASRLRASAAIARYDKNDNATMVSTDCVAGTGDDTIVLPTKATLNMACWVQDSDNYTGPAASPMVESRITIDGNGATLVLAASSGYHACNGATGSSVPVGMRLFAIGSNGHLELHDVRITGFHVKGGDGRSGGGGGLGAGGAIYVAYGGFAAFNSTFDSNGAQGGNGSELKLENGGGGGGLSGNGGSSELASSSTGYYPYQGGGGGGGSLGDGGAGNVNDFAGGGGGGGGGTVHSGYGGEICLDCQDNPMITKGTGGDGFSCAGAGGFGNGFGGGVDGNDASCPGGGGGGGQSYQPFVGVFGCGHGGSGSYGGGGGGGGYDCGDGGQGGFGGGGGAGSNNESFVDNAGGSGGFGGGGGASVSGPVSGGPGKGGHFGGNANATYGGGGGALGGAIFNDSGAVVIKNSTFYNNYAARGEGGGNGSSGAADNGADAGGAIFSRNGSTTIVDSTIAYNQGTGSGSGVVVYEDGESTSFVLQDTIIANNNGADTCFWTGSVSHSGVGNLIMDNGSGTKPFGACDGVMKTVDPQLGPLQDNGGPTWTMAIPLFSSAMSAADAGTSLPYDQRYADRPQLGGYDIGAYEICRRFLAGRLTAAPCSETNAPPPFPVTLTMAVSPADGGTTTPPIGNNNETIDSVQPISATPAYGYRFGTWSPNVTDPANPSTTVIMNQNQTVTAYFNYCGCALDVGNAIKVTRSGFVLNLVTGRYVQTVTLTNVSAGAVSGPISLVLDNLSSYASLYNPSGTTDSLEPPAGSAYTNITNNTLAAGASVSMQLQFTDPTRTTPINYTTRVLAGPGMR